jgi:hypothetical protein
VLVPLLHRGASLCGRRRDLNGGVLRSTSTSRALGHERRPLLISVHSHDALGLEVVLPGIIRTVQYISALSSDQCDGDVDVLHE